MKESRSIPLDEIRKAIGDPFAMGESDVHDFLTRYDTNEIDVPSLPPHLLAAPLARTIANGQAAANMQSQSDSLEQLAIAARNGEEPLSEETLRKMMDSQDEEEES